MSESANKHKDPLVEDAVALLQDAARHGQVDKNTLPPAPFTSVETNVVVATHFPDGHRSVIAASSLGIMAAPVAQQRQPNPPPSTIQPLTMGASGLERTEQTQADLVDEMLSMMRAVSEEQRAVQPPREHQPAAKPAIKKVG